ncbi:hypothetical protein GCM10011491_23340 [Brucella endophytica]|uniref:Uncharacterized protein n=1 Tax=Brucella endophytica TaxID=1963359 RepID=A0A916SDF2_9HYPH|nr:hypothetical protein GCM10011491_23340 [Brucella endophytica]
MPGSFTLNKGLDRCARTLPKPQKNVIMAVEHGNQRGIGHSKILVETWREAISSTGRHGRIGTQMQTAHNPSENWNWAYAGLAVKTSSKIQLR